MKVLIVDDELLSGQLLEDQLKINCPEISSISRFISPNKAIDALESTVFDILFLDVEMPEMNCFDFLKQVRLPERTSVIIVTAYSHYAIEAFKHEALHYLLKPVEPKELITAVDRVKKTKQTSTIEKKSASTLSIYNGSSYSIVKKRNVVRLEADGSYTTIFLKNGNKMMNSKRLGHFESLLETPPFCRCHNSHIININYIISIDNGRSGFLELEDGSQIPISHHYKSNLKTILNF